MPRLVHPPIRRREIARLASEHRDLFQSCSVDEIADARSIILVREPTISGPEPAGFAFAHWHSEPSYIDSLARPGEKIRQWGKRQRVYIRSVVLNPRSPIPEREIFAHEYFHLFYSPEGIQQSERFQHTYSTETVLTAQEERRADEFAVRVLIPDLRGLRSVREIAERFDVSERLAGIAFELGAKRLFE